MIVNLDRLFENHPLSGSEDFRHPDGTAVVQDPQKTTGDEEISRLRRHLDEMYPQCRSHLCYLRVWRETHQACLELSSGLWVICRGQDCLMVGRVEAVDATTES